METILLVLHLLFAIFLVVFILVQQASGNALDGLGGGGNSVNSLLSARGTGNLLTKVTAILATLFIISSLTLSIYYRNPQNSGRDFFEVEENVEMNQNTEDKAPEIPNTEE